MVNLKAAVLKNVICCRYFGSRIPISVQFALTNRCPWRCLYCNINDKNTPEVTTEEARFIVQQLAKNRTRRLHLVGGEPLLRDDIGEIVAEAKSPGLFVTIATSGYQIPENWEKIKDVDIFFLSFDGPEEINDLQRGKGAFEVLFRSIEFLKDKKKKFWTTTVITHQNVGHLNYILKVAKEKGFVANFHLLYFSPEFGEEHESIHPASLDAKLVMSDDEYRYALRYLLKRKKGDMRQVIGSSASYFKTLLKWDDFTRVYKNEKSKDYDCMAGRMFCYIDANADIYPCCDVMGMVKPRNILKEGFKEAFLHLPEAPCKSCLVACYLELNLMFSLRLESILNWSKRV
jgi:MoaA/NifB/PqqE/SkfB family radical SAM enzyme